MPRNSAYPIAGHRAGIKESPLAAQKLQAGAVVAERKATLNQPQGAR